MSYGSKPGPGTPSRTSMPSTNRAHSGGSARRSCAGQSPSQQDKDIDRDASGQIASHGIGDQPQEAK